MAQTRKTTVLAKKLAPFEDEGNRIYSYFSVHIIHI